MLNPNISQQTMGAIAGIIAPILAFCCILIAILSYPDFSWTNNALSDLGIISGLTAPIFNFGLFASGLLAFYFAVFGLFSYFKRNPIGKIGSLSFTAATLSLMGIGIFNENFSPTHYIVSVVFFALTPIALLFLAFAFYLNEDRRMVVFTLFISIFSAGIWFLNLILNYFPNVAIPEFASGLAISIWAIVMSKKMLKFQPLHS